MDKKYIELTGENGQVRYLKYNIIPGENINAVPGMTVTYKRVLMQRICL